MTSPDPDALRALLAPYDPDRFLADYWDKKALYIPGTPEKFASLNFSMDAFRAMARAERLPGTFKAQYYDAEGRDRYFVTDPRHLDDLYAAGMTVCMADLERFSPEIAALSQAIKVGLSLPGALSFGCYCSPNKAGFGLHFDCEHVFSLQIEGSKLWRYSSAPAVPDPIGDVAVTDPEMRERFARANRWVELHIPSEADLVETLMRPGDVLYMPPGSWHRARGVSHSLALSLACMCHRFTDLLAEVLPTKLLPVPALRRGVPAVSSMDVPAEGLPPQVEQYLAERLDELRRLVARLTPADFAQSWRRLVRS